MSLTIISIVFLILGLSLLFSSFRRLKQRRVISAAGRGGMSVLLLLIGFLFVAFAMNFYTYDRLSKNWVLADIRIIKIAPQRYRVELLLPSGKKSDFDVSGDNWLITGKVVKWTANGNLIGLNAQYRLDRITGQYSDITEEREKQRTVYAISPTENNFLKGVVKQFSGWMPFLDSYFVGGAGHPMADKAHFQLRATQSNMVSYPMNQAAKDAVANWK